MRPLRLLPVTALAALALAAPASAHVAHTVQPGETLWSIAAQSNLTTRTLAAYNGVAEDARVVLGSTILVPSVAEGAAALTGGTAATPVRRAPARAPAAPTARTAPPVRSGYVVRPGDTLTGLAAHAGVSVAQMAYVNGLPRDARLIAGTVLKLPGGAPAPVRSTQPVPRARVVPPAAPRPAPGRLSAGRVAALAADHGVPGALAAAIGYQESGLNNSAVSSANARGIMQVLPGTWDWVQRNLAPRTLDPGSPEDNVRAGALYLGSLLRETGGNPALAAAGYYQGMASVRRIGLLPETQRYVNNVLALRTRFGG